MAKQSQFQSEEVHAAFQLVFSLAATAAATALLRFIEPKVVIETTAKKMAFTRREAAQYIGCSTTTLDRYRTDGEIDYGCHIGSRPKYLKKDLDRFLERLITRKGGRH